MCGIYGVISFNGTKIEESWLLGMGLLLKHRGPDSTNIKLYKKDGLSCFLGSNRLKIIDLSDSANMPVENEDNSVAVVFNGEIYNYRSLKEQLQRKAHIFKTKTDSEIIPHAFEEYDSKCFSLFDGMFSIAIWDGKTGRLVLARDRTGKKPLFYYYDGKMFAFASEIKALLSLPFVSKRINEKKIPEYLTYGYINGPETFYDGIYEIPPASSLIVEDDQINQVEKYWELEFIEKDAALLYSFEEAKKAVRGSVINAISKRLVSDVPLGVFLSGGIDSAIITGVISSLLGKKVNTFTVGFEDNQSFDERKSAAFLAGHYKTQHTEMSACVKDISLLEKISESYDMPCGDPSALPAYIVCKMAKQNVTVALNGDGGDEAFAGYDRFKAALLADKIPDIFFPAGRVLASLIPRSDDYSGMRRRLERFFGAAKNKDVMSRHHEWITVFNEELIKKIYKKTGYGRVTRSEDVYLKCLTELPLLHKLLYLNMKTYLAQNLNVKMDRMSMANSMETRSPFLDTEVIEIAALLPPDFKINKGITKHVLRESFKDILPEKTLSAKKHGFGIPLSSWFKGELGKYFSNKLLDVKPSCLPYIDIEIIQKLFNEHLKGKKDRSKELWLLLQFELWLECNKF
ncbi:MAG: asparagine synthase (glutamine-hydrolyzing) [Candidatus Firestonebacteria bacterium RIFOXYA2_FULL_40_8]|nr:MAG: asparagine synthase (glutamine-hydrolyzing) [Candidatus Firestonebacteria bacterium RIFOXYA2_FULL_40_8]